MSTQETKHSPEDAIMSAVRAVTARKQAARIVPDHALIIRDKLMSFISGLTGDGFYRVLDRMEKEGRIEVGPTINDTFVREIR